MSTLRSPKAEEHDEIVNCLTSLRQPLPLSPAALVELAERASIMEVLRGEVVIAQGNAPDYLYFVLSGHLRAADMSGDQPHLLSYDTAQTFVGAHGMEHKTPRTATVDAISDARLACWDQGDFDWLVETGDGVCGYFDSIHQQRIARAQRPFPGKHWDEVVVFQGGRHPLQLVQALMGPALLIVAAAILLIGLSSIQVPAILIEIFVGLPAALAVAWGTFNCFDWRNDEYIVTSKRVIHIERMLLYGEEWDEAPLVRVQDVTVEAHTWLQRVLDYSSLKIKTAGAGVLVFAGMRGAERVRELIFQEQAKARERRAADDKGSIRAALAQKMGRQIPDVKTPVDARVPAGARSDGSQPRRLPPLIDYLYPRLAIVEGDSIAWRKHWLILVRKVAPPLLLFAIALAATILVLRFDMAYSYLMVVLVLGVAAAIIWYFLRYDDWHRDVYIVTGNRIIDVESSAFRLRGERRREGTFDAVQNVTYSIPNFLCRLLNMGDVVIETAGTERTFTFNSVFDPSAVQQEVFHRWDAYHEDRRRREKESEAQRLADWIGEYDEMRQQAD
jgi:uncharacterized membrane protein YdbT with pleckstrin-like domain